MEPIATIILAVVLLAFTVGLFVASTRKRRKAIEDMPDMPDMPDQRNVETLILKGEDLGLVEPPGGHLLGDVVSEMELLPETEPVEEPTQEPVEESDNIEESLPEVPEGDQVLRNLVVLRQMVEGIDRLGRDVRAQNQFLNRLATSMERRRKVTPTGPTVITDVSPVVEAIESLGRQFSRGRAKVLSSPRGAPAEVMVSTDPGFDTIKVVDIPVKGDPTNHETKLNALLDEGWRLITATPLADPASALPEVRYVFGAKKENS